MHRDGLDPVADVARGGEGAWVGGSREAGPAAAALELLLGAKELGAAARAKVAAGLVVVPESAGKRTLGGLLPKHAILLGRQLAAPLLVALLDLLVHVQPQRAPSSQAQVRSVASANEGATKRTRW